MVCDPGGAAADENDAPRQGQVDDRIALNAVIEIGNRTDADAAAGEV